MRKLLLAACMVGLVGCPWVPQDNGYRLAWEDNFDGTELAPEWTVRWDNGDITVNDGLLTLTNDGTGWTGIHTADTAWQEGYFEARVRWDDNAYAWPAVWLFSKAHTDTFPTMDAHCPTLVAELDILESLVPAGHPSRPQEVHHTLHRNTQTVASDPDGSCGEPDTVNVPPVRTVAGEGVDLSGWHVYGARWTSSDVCWFVDGVETGCAPTFDSTAQPMHWILSAQVHGCRSWLYPDGCPPAPAVQTLQVDWVRVWSPAG